ncbi:MAG: hypothetical protein JXR03_20465 [Cyclobacteriaceae bacterium]
MYNLLVYFSPVPSCLMKTIMSCTFLLCLIGTVQSQESVSIQNADSVSEKFIRHVIEYSQEKIYIVTDKPYYAAGDTIWFQTFLVDAITHQPSRMSTTIYVDFMNHVGKKIGSVILPANEGLAPGDFVISDKAIPGKYMIQAYTRWMTNFPEEYIFRKKFDVLPIWPRDKDQPEEKSVSNANTRKRPRGKKPDAKEISIRLFPEGGDLVSGIPAIVGIQASINGNPEKRVQAKGRIVSVSNGEVVANFDCNQFGIDAFFLPNPSNNYLIVLDSPSLAIEYRFPTVKPQGYGINVRNGYESKKVQVLLRTNEPEGLNGGYLIGHVRGQMFCSATIKNDKLVYRNLISIDKSLIPSGVAHFTFFDKSGIPRTERLIYVDHGDISAPVSILRQDSVFTKREKVKLKVKLENELQGNVALSVTNASVIDRSADAGSIGSYLMLSSDVNGLIEGAGYYFSESQSSRFRELDFLLLTHGWRRFVWDDILKQEEDKDYLSVEQGITFSGALKNFAFRKKAARGNLELITITNGFTYFEDESENDGRFSFDHLEFYDTLDFIIQAKKKSKSNKNSFFIGLDKMTPPLISPFDPSLDLDEEVSEDFIEKSNKKFIIEKNFGSDVIVLDAFEVIGKTEDPFEKITLTASQYFDPDYRIIADSMVAKPSSLYEMLVQIPFVNVTPAGAVTIRGSRAIIFIDNLEIDSGSASSVVQSTPGYDIYFIDVDRSGISTGTEGPSIHIYTKSGNGIQPNYANEELPGILHITHPGYYKAREFHSPNYDPMLPEVIKPDYRLQLYWQPRVKIENGEAEVSFYTGDDKDTYDIVLEGLTISGKMIKETKQIKVK